MLSSSDILGQDGPFSAKLPSFKPRQVQQEMAAHIEGVLDSQGELIAESGTGTGKTYAYLVPALCSEKKILISTGTKHLQDQLYNKDLPLVVDVLGLSTSTALLKGRSNYLCRHRLERHANQSVDIARRFAKELYILNSWAATTRSGDISEVAEVSDESSIWPSVTSTIDNCLGSKCGFYEKCHVNHARRRALDADIVIVNHHLFFADLALREDGFGQLLPGVEAVIFDEAHQLPHTAPQFLGWSLSSGQLLELCSDSLIAEAKEKSGVRDLSLCIAKMENGVAQLRLEFGASVRKVAVAQLLEEKGISAKLLEFEKICSDLLETLESAAIAGEELTQCWQRAGVFLERLNLLISNESEDRVQWMETSKRGFTFHTTPLDVGEPFRRHIDSQNKAWIFTSATLAVGENFTHFQQQMGLDHAECVRWASPFNYVDQALLYLPEGLPSPAAKNFVNKVVQAALPLIEASKGRTFMLFTSHRALQIAAEMLSGRIEYPILVQGSTPRTELLQRFKDLGNAVLLGTSSFWEGVDVQGQSLTTVIIDKLPFAMPDDPVMRAKLASIEEKGQNPFMEYQVPEAVITLNQGVGRLIRDNDDWGVMMICDPRLLTKGYGKVFINSLPPMKRTQKLNEVTAFLQSIGEGHHREMSGATSGK
ncbi:ATP-dependent DNA helicase [Pseudomonadota bacterium]